MKTWFQERYEWGLTAWRMTYKRGTSDQDGFQIVDREMAATAANNGFAVDMSAAAQTLELLATGKWVHGACRHITTTGSYFAAMACTRMHSSAASDLHVPWPSFGLDIPPGVLVHGDGTEYRHALITEFENLSFGDGSADRVVRSFTLTSIETEPGSGAPEISVLSPRSMAETLFTPTMDLADLGDEESSRITEQVGVQWTQRLVETVHRAVAGLLYTMQHTKFWRPSPFAALGSRQLRGGPPPHRSIVVGRPLTIDCRASLRAALTDGGTAPSVQTLVRGHIKRQVFGTGRSGRKVIWVEPYWRGPEDAPILARPYKVGGAA